MTHTLLMLDKGYPGMEEALSQHFELVKPKGRDPESVIRSRSQDIQGLITNLTPVRRSLLEALPNLEIIAVGGVGYDNVDVTAALERGIIVTHTPSVLTDDTADTAVMLMMNIMRRAVEGDAFIRAGMWQQKPLSLGVSLAGKTVGIVGLGRIGKAIAARCEAHRMSVVYHGPNKKDVSYTYYDDIHKMAADVDVLILACVGGEKTKGLINASVLKELGANGFLVNIARGTVVNEQDLVVALQNKVIAGAGLDVFENEPHVPQELFTMDHVVLTPHIGSLTVETRTKMGQIVVGNMLAHFEGKPLLTPVPECKAA